jgi:nucleoside-diphosphate-sugar epimerase
MVNEQSALNPTSRRYDLRVYAQTKMEADKLVIETARKSGFTYSILRPSKVLGPYMNDRSLDQLITMINRGIFFFIGKPGASANYVYVENLVDALVLCGQLPKARGQIYNLSDYATLEHLVEVICDELGKPAPWLRLPESLVRVVTKPLQKIPGFPLTEFRIAGMTHRPVYSYEKIKKELGFVHKVLIGEGLRQLVGIWKQSK